jgi:hypothetical protein
MASTIVPKNIDDCKLNYPIASRKKLRVEFCGSMGFMSVINGTLQHTFTKRVEECIVDVKKAFPYGDLSVHVDRPESLP